jgi:hypothetical protein
MVCVMAAGVRTGLSFLTVVRDMPSFIASHRGADMAPSLRVDVHFVGQDDLPPMPPPMPPRSRRCIPSPSATPDATSSMTCSVEATSSLTTMAWMRGACRHGGPWAWEARPRRWPPPARDLGLNDGGRRPPSSTTVGGVFLPQIR